MRPWVISASRKAIFWNPPAASATSSACCRRPWRAVSSTAWSWTASPGASRPSSIQRPGSPCAGLKRYTFQTAFLMWQSATCPLDSTRSMTRPTTSWASTSITISLPRRWTRCVRAALWRFSPPVIPWTQRTRRCAGIWRSGPSCWGLSACPTMRSRPTPGRKWSPTSSSCKSGTTSSTLCRTGCGPVRRRRASPSTTISQRTRRWYWGGPLRRAPSMGIRTIPCAPSRARTLPSSSMKRWGASTAKSRKWRCRNWAMKKNPYRRPQSPQTPM